MAVILVIEDEPGMRTIISKILTAEGHSVIEANDGGAGLRAFRTADPALVITDILMPDKEGIETIRELRSGHPDLKIIAISGGGQSGKLNFLDIAKTFGANFVLQKPFKADALRDAVDCLIARSKPLDSKC